MSTKSTRRMAIPDDELCRLILELAKRFHGGHAAPNLSRFEMARPRDYPNPRKLLIHRGYTPDAKGSYSEAWAQLVKSLTGLSVHLPIKPSGQTLVVEQYPPLPDERKIAQQEALSYGLPVSSFWEDDQRIYYLLR